MTEGKKKRKRTVLGSMLLGGVVGLGAAVAATLRTKKGRQASRRLRETADEAAERLKEVVTKSAEVVREQKAILGAGLQAGRRAIQRKRAAGAKRVTKSTGKRTRRHG